MSTKADDTGRLGILAGGGPAPGINAVIGAATIEAGRHGLDVVGILDGAKWLASVAGIAPLEFHHRSGCIVIGCTYWPRMSKLSS